MDFGRHPLREVVRIDMCVQGQTVAIKEKCIYSGFDCSRDRTLFLMADSSYLPNLHLSKLHGRSRVSAHY